jgi:hypothetical protein
MEREADDVIEVGRHYKVDSPGHFWHGKVVCVDDFSINGVCEVSSPAGGKFSINSNKLVNLNARMIIEKKKADAKANAEETSDLLDAAPARLKADEDNLKAAHEERTRQYRKDSSRAVKKWEVSTKVSDAMDRISAVNRELYLYNTDRQKWKQQYFHPDPIKIGVTAGIQAANLGVFIGLAMSGAGALLIPLICPGVIYLNYLALKNDWIGSR